MTKFEINENNEFNINLQFGILKNYKIFYYFYIKFSFV